MRLPIASAPSKPNVPTGDELYDFTVPGSVASERPTMPNIRPSSTWTPVPLLAAGADCSTVVGAAAAASSSGEATAFGAASCFAGAPPSPGGASSSTCELASGASSTFVATRFGCAFGCGLAALEPAMSAMLIENTSRSSFASPFAEIGDSVSEERFPSAS